jgi:hypothetical protein
MNADHQELLRPLPGLFLEFREAEAFADAPPAFRSPRAVDIAGVLSTIDALYAVEVLDFEPPTPDQGELEWVAGHHILSRRMTLKAARFESPLQILLELPAYAYVTAGAFGGFLGTISYVFGVPYKAAAWFHRARAEYFESRIDAYDKKQEWLDRKAQQVKRIPFELHRLDSAEKLPPRADDPPTQ